MQTSSTCLCKQTLHKVATLCNACWQVHAHVGFHSVFFSLGRGQWLFVGGWNGYRRGTVNLVCACMQDQSTFHSSHIK